MDDNQPEIQIKKNETSRFAFQIDIQLELSIIKNYTKKFLNPNPKKYFFYIIIKSIFYV